MVRDWDSHPLFVTHRASGPIYADDEFREVAERLLSENDYLKHQVRGLQCDTCQTRNECGATVRPLCHIKGVNHEGAVT